MVLLEIRQLICPSRASWSVKTFQAWRTKVMGRREFGSGQVCKYSAIIVVKVKHDLYMILWSLVFSVPLLYSQHNCLCGCAMNVIRETVQLK